MQGSASNAGHRQRAVRSSMCAKCVLFEHQQKKLHLNSPHSLEEPACTPFVVLGVPVVQGGRFLLC